MGLSDNYSNKVDQIMRKQPSFKASSRSNHTPLTVNSFKQKSTPNQASKQQIKPVEPMSLH
jgi:hypothetical protein